MKQDHTSRIPFAVAKPMDDAEIIVQAQPVQFAVSSIGAHRNPECEPTVASSQSSGYLPFQLIGDQSVALLKGQGYSTGLIQALAELKQNVFKQVWIIDDSGSMLCYDGELMEEDVNESTQFKFSRCSRWEELQQTVMEHMKLAGALQLPTSFRLLNRGERDLNICLGPDSTVQRDVDRCLSFMEASTPRSGTPLKRHVCEVRHEVEAQRRTIEAAEQVVSIVIATDGLPTDASHDEFVEELKRFRDLPVRIVIRLCTDEKEIVDYYNALDQALEYSIDVIDDFRGEAVEVAKVTPWLTYSLPLHRIREMGMKHIVLDLLDERPLTKSEYKQVCSILFGEEAMLQAPNPVNDWAAFVGYVDSLQREETGQWDPILSSVQPWVDFRARTTKSKARKAKKMGGAPSLLSCFGW